ncbi:MAG: histidinol-phosphate transaminase [Candidatus Omnitrophota bacterium]
MKSGLFKNHIQSIHPYEPGKPIKEVERELGLKRVIKLASNENPLGPSGKAVRAMRRALRETNLYPEGSCFYLATKLAAKLDLPRDRILFGNGSNEIIELLARGFVSEGDEVLSSEISFLVYPILTQVCGGKYVSVPMKDHRYDLEGILRAVTPRTRLIFIANPNNPTGTYVTAAELDGFLARVPDHVIVCLDEAYVDFVNAGDFPDAVEMIKRGRENLVVLRTFSKSYGLAGLRIGYGLAHPSIIGYLSKIRQPFNVNSLAQTAAAAALEDNFFLWRTRTLVNWGRRYLYKRFQRMGIRFLDSQANFVLIDTERDGEKIYQALLRKGVIVRPMSAYGLPSWLRVTVGRRGQNAFFIRQLKLVLRETA